MGIFPDDDFVRPFQTAIGMKGLKIVSSMARVVITIETEPWRPC